MTLTRLSLYNPIAVLVGALLVVLFGGLSLTRLPVQLTPEVQAPEITITTSWRGAAPNEVEAEIIEPQEDVLRGLPGMTELLANAQQGRAQVTLTFQIDMDLRRALLEVLNRLNQVPDYPDDADEPIVTSVGADARAIAWFIVKAVPGNERDISSYQDYVEEVVQTRFERVPGVARSEVLGGRDTEIRISFDPYKAAAMGVGLPVAAQLAGSGKDISAGSVDVGKRAYNLRFQGTYDPEQLTGLIIDWRQGLPVYLRDIATVERRLVDRDSFVLTQGSLSIAVNAQRETGVNVLEVMQGLYQAQRELTEGPLKRAGLSIEQVYDETLYIDNSIRMLRNNLGLGVLLAISVLWWFLRKLRATLLVAAAIPLCLLGAFVVLDAAGKTLNVISLAGLAFATGMVLDAAIVVLENIVRLRERGEAAETAAHNGTTQVWGALLASTATTVAIFLPLVFLQDETGQLFADLALTISVAIVFSLLVAVTVIPAAAKGWLAQIKLQDPHAHWWRGGSALIMALTNGPWRRACWILLLTTLPLAVTYLLLPKADYLPEGNRNLVFAFILPPPGANITHLEKTMGVEVARRLQPHIDGGKEPAVKHYFFVALSRGAFMGVRAVDPAKTAELIPLINSVVNGFPDTLAFAKRASLFGGFGEGRTIDVNLQGRDIESLLGAARTAYAAISQQIPGASVRPFPGLDLAQPELRMIPDERRIAEAGWNRAIMADVVRALGDGLLVGDYFDGEQTLDIIVRARQWHSPEELAGLPLATPNAGIQPLGELVKLLRTAGPEQIRRLNRRRTITLQVTPPEDLSLEEALDTIQSQVIPQIAPLMPADGDIGFGGTADKLESALVSMGGGFVLAIVILYLLMSALFRSFLDSLLVLMVVPLATVGGVVALYLANKITFQPMDLLTMIGFIILLGLVVNNAILLVYQTRNAERDGQARRAAVAQAVQLRLRPILMSTLTSIFGMLPLLLIPGAGTELYRGLAAVIVGGMGVSTVFTLVLLPSLLRVGEGRAA